MPLRGATELFDELMDLIEDLSREAGLDPNHVFTGMSIGFGVWVVFGAWAGKRAWTNRGKAPKNDAEPGGLLGATQEVLKSVYEGELPDCCIAKFQGEDVAASQLTPKKELGTAYMLLCFTGWTGAHHFYLDRWMNGLVCLWSMNLFGVGLLLDLASLPSYVKEANKDVVDQARSDGSGRHIFTRLPVVCCGFSVVAACLVAGLPFFLQTSNLMDIERMGAGTERSPFDVLGVQRGSSAAKVNEVYSSKMKVLRALSPCDKPCRTEKEELRKARLFAIGKGWKTGVSWKDFQEPEQQLKRRPGADRGSTEREHSDPRGAHGRHQRTQTTQRPQHRQDPYQGQRRPDWDDWAAWKLKNPLPFGGAFAHMQGLHSRPGDRHDRVGDSIRRAEENIKMRERQKAAEAAAAAEKAHQPAGAEAKQQPSGADSKQQPGSARAEEQPGATETKQELGGAEAKQQSGGAEAKQPEAAESTEQPGGAETPHKPFSREEEAMPPPTTPLPKKEPPPTPEEAARPPEKDTPRRPDETPAPPIGSTHDWQGQDWVDYTMHAWEILGKHTRDSLAKVVNDFDIPASAKSAWSDEL